MTAYYACEDCGTALTQRARYCIECHRDRQARDDERNAEWWAQ